MGRQPFSPLAPPNVLTVSAQAVRPLAMLDSGSMPEREDNPPTLASLRARKAKLRSGKRSSPPPASSSSAQPDLFFLPHAPVPSSVNPTNPSSSAPAAHQSSIAPAKQQAKPTLPALPTDR